MSYFIWARLKHTFKTKRDNSASVWEPVSVLNYKNAKPVDDQMDLQTWVKTVYETDLGIS